MVLSLAEVSSAYRGRRVLITGASGFVGRWVARLLHAGGAELCLAARSRETVEILSESYQFSGKIFATSLAEPGAFARLHRDARPDVTFHLAGYGVDPTERDPTLSERLNHALLEDIAGVVAAAPAAGWPGLPLVHAGSAAEYGAVAGPVTEASPENPLNLYGRTKLAGTRALQGGGLRATTARLFTIYGPGEHAHRLLPSILATAESGGTLGLTAGQQQRDFTYVAEAAEGLLRLGASSAPVPPVINIATGALTSVRRFAETAGEVLGMRPAQLNFGALPTRPDEAPHGPVSTALLEATLGWKPVIPVREGIRQTAAFAARLFPAKSGVRS
jgi:UDP-glucose 4-epimerase